MWEFLSLFSLKVKIFTFGLQSLHEDQLAQINMHPWPQKSSNTYQNWAKEALIWQKSSQTGIHTYIRTNVCIIIISCGRDALHIYKQTDRRRRPLFSLYFVLSSFFRRFLPISPLAVAASPLCTQPQSIAFPSTQVSSIDLCTVFSPPALKIGSNFPN